jgi:ATP-dependent DNA helicase RecG
MIRLDDPVNKISGVGDKKAKLFSKLGIDTVRDLIYFAPRLYEQPGQMARICDLTEDKLYCIEAVISAAPGFKRVRNGLNLSTFALQDATGRVEAVFFNQPYIRNLYKKGERVFVTGKLKRVGGKLKFTNPQMERGNVRREGLTPVYALTAGLTQKVMRLAVAEALKQTFGSVEEYLPAGFRAEHALAEINYSLQNIHFPADQAAMEEAKRRLVFEELLLFHIALSAREDEMIRGAQPIAHDEQSLPRFEARLGYTPTAAQRRVMKEIEADLARERPMNRLLQGDVGSGKTTPAFYAMYLCVQNGCQCAMMAPTEVLARQHYQNALRVLGDLGVNIELLTGSTPAAPRRAILEGVAGGQTDILIGTHALVYNRVQFFNLALVITDEQHRFGVGQRAMLESKSKAPHTLIMSATPIPRSLALILFGKTDISVIDEMPPGRRPVKTFCVPEHKREDMYGFLQKEMEKGAQVFVVCPLVEDNEAADMRSSEQIYKALSQRFRSNGVALLHGRMRPEEKNDIMAQFKAKKFHLLVSTTVIEVGVDVPDATVMVIEDAQRFGLAQLHQLRGRVGRSDQASYCFLMSDGKENDRLSVLTSTNDGFVIAEEDLKQRGPGQFLGSNQSGASDLYMAHMISDMRLFSETRNVAEMLHSSDIILYNELKTRAEERFQRRIKKTSIQ